MAILTTDLGKVMPLLKGEYNPATPYLMLDVVTKDGNYYLSKLDENEGNAVTNTTWWQLISREGERQTAEATRGENEADRIQAEGLRAGAETSRQTAEGLRVQAEINRQTNTGTAIQNAETATTNAGNAASLANTKAGLADTAANLANEVANNPDKVVADYWHKWNTTTKAYENTGIKAKGEPGAVALVEQTVTQSTINVPCGKAVNDELTKRDNILMPYVDATRVNGYNITAGLLVTNINNSNPPSAEFEPTWDYQNAWIDNKGKLIYYTAEITCKFMKVHPSSLYRYVGNLRDNASICFYDKNKVFLSGRSATNFGKNTDIYFVTPNSCYYIKATCLKTTIEAGGFNIKYVEDYSLKNGIPSNSYQGQLPIVGYGDITLVDSSMLKNTSYDLSDKISKSILGVSELRGGSSPCYSFKRNIGSKFSLHTKVKFPSDVHDVDISYDILTLKSQNNTTLSVKLKKAKTASPTIAPLCPVPEYKTAIEIYKNGTKINELIPDGWNKELLLGDDAMSFRFKGDCSIVSNQDIRITINETEVKIYHSSDNSVIATFTKSNYSTLQLLYEAILQETISGALTDFEIEWINLDRKTPASIIMCDVPLVASYYRDNANTVSEYDAFPFYFTTKEIGRTYDIEILLDKDNYYSGQVVIDGYGLGLYTYDLIPLCDREIEFTIGDVNIDGSGININNISFSDDAKSIYPNVRVYYFEGVSEGLNSIGLDASQKRVAGMASLMRENDAKFSNLDDIIKYLDGYKIYSEKIFHISHDDNSYEIVDNEKIRNTYISNNIYPSTSLLLNNAMTEQTKANLKMCRALGFNYHIHNASTASLVGKGIGCYSYSELKTAVSDSVLYFSTQLLELPRIWNFHWITENYNVVRYLKNKGFVLIFGGNGSGSINKINRYRCRRLHCIDEVSYDAIKNTLTNYVT